MEGEVRLSIDNYNALIRKVDSYERAITLEYESYDNKVHVNVNLKAFEPVLQQRLAAKKLDTEWEMDLRDQSYDIYSARDNFVKFTQAAEEQLHQ